MNILVAEDQLTPALFLRRLLERLGHEVTIASDGLEAWRIFRESSFPVLISDWMMPGMDGLQLCRKIRSCEFQSYSYLILLTSKESKEERIAGLRAGADDFLVKPPDVHELAVRLEIARRILSVQEQLNRRNRMLSEMALSDELTGVNNRRRFHESLEIHHSIALSRGVPLSLVMLDVDNFKSYNDTFGHPAGDEVLKLVARSLKQGIRKQDEVARIGGEEFAVLLPDTDIPASLELAERLRAAVAGQTWPLRPVTASLGVSTSSVELTSGSILVEEADRALYRSKRSGKDQVSHYRECSVEETSPRRREGETPRADLSSPQPEGGRIDCH